MHVPSVQKPGLHLMEHRAVQSKGQRRRVSGMEAASNAGPGLLRGIHGTHTSLKYEGLLRGSPVNDRSKLALSPRGASMIILMPL